MTSQLQIQKARFLVEAIAKLNQVQTAHLDDWDNDGRFSIFISPPSICSGGDRFNRRIDFKVDLRGILPRIKRLIKSVNGVFEWAESPKKVYSGKGKVGRGRYDEGYDRSDYKISVYIPQPLPPPPCSSEASSGQKNS